MKRLADFFYGPVAPVRTYALSRMLPCLLALDIWLLMIGHAGRYGVADFNVAHFAVLDALLPIPSAGAYIGVLITAGMFCLLYAFGCRSRWVSIPMFALYTLSWTWSMLDSYQHHYFMSLVLLCLTLIEPQETRLPNSTAPQETTAADVPAATGGGYVMLTSTVAVLYGYAALAKCDAVWLDGHTLRQISQAERLLGPLSRTLEGHGLSVDRLYALLATSVVPLEVLLSVAYAMAPLRDRTGSLALQRGLSAAALLAISLHLGAEGLDLKIGWFSYYMLALGLICLGPATWLTRLLRPMRYMERSLQRLLGEIASEGSPLVPLALAALTLPFLVYVGYSVDLPGALSGMTLFALVLLGSLGAAAARRHLASAVPAQLSALAAGLVLWMAIGSSDARFDFYRFLGGDQARRGETAAAIETYERGERYAPAGKSRRRKIDQLRGQQEWR